MTASEIPAPETKLSHSEVIMIISGVVVAMFLAALDQTIVVTAMPTIGRALGNPEYLPWIITSYLLASTAVTPLYETSAKVTLLWECDSTVLTAGVNRDEPTKFCRSDDTQGFWAQ